VNAFFKLVNTLIPKQIPCPALVSRIDENMINQHVSCYHPYIFRTKVAGSRTLRDWTCNIGIQNPSYKILLSSLKLRALSKIYPTLLQILRYL
jgi:hypothetical protein